MGSLVVRGVLDGGGRLDWERTVEALSSLKPVSLAQLSVVLAFFQTFGRCEPCLKQHH